MLAQFLAHMHSHHRLDGRGACESCTSCSSYAPRSLCSLWLD